MTELESYKAMIDSLVEHLDDVTVWMKEQTKKESYLGYVDGYNNGLAAGHERAVDFMKNFMKGWIESYNEREGGQK